MFMLNLLFDVTKPVPDGLFSNDFSNAPLRRSKNWLRLRGAEPTFVLAPPAPLPIDPEEPVPTTPPGKWRSLGDVDDGPLHLPRFPGGEIGNICVRFAPFPGSSTLTAADRLTLSVCFGRPTMKNQVVASPFADANGPITTFVLTDQAPNTSLAGVPAAWAFHLGPVQRAADSVHHPRRFEYSVGIIVTVGGVTRHFSLDPEVDIGPDPENP